MLAGRAPCSPLSLYTPPSASSPAGRDCHQVLHHHVAGWLVTQAVRPQLGLAAGTLPRPEGHHMWLWMSSFACGVPVPGCWGLVVRAVSPRAWLLAFSFCSDSSPLVIPRWLEQGAGWLRAEGERQQLRTPQPEGTLACLVQGHCPALDRQGDASSPEFWGERPAGWMSPSRVGTCCSLSFPTWLTAAVRIR